VLGQGGLESLLGLPHLPCKLREMLPQTKSTSFSTSAFTPLISKPNT